MSDRDPVPLLYAAAMGEAAWEDALGAMSHHLRGATVLVGAADGRQPSSLCYWAYGFDASPLRQDGFREADLWDPATNPCVRAAMRMPLRESRDHRAYFSSQAFRDDPFLSHCMVRQDIVNGRMFTLAREPDLLAGGFATRRGGGEIEEKDARQLDSWLVHVAQALRLRAQVHMDQCVSSGLRSVLDHLGLGVVLVDPTLRILVANAAAEDVFAARDGIRSERGRLCLASREHHRRLAQAVTGSGRKFSVIGLPRPSGLPAYAVRLFPASGVSGIPGAQSACMVLTIQDPAGTAGLPLADDLQAAFGLSPAEAAVARLAPLALSKAQMAEQLGLSENTVRTHLTAARAKLGARNMVELALRVAQG